jgi:hypothetical protein
MSIASQETSRPESVEDTARWKMPVTYRDLEFFAEQIFPWQRQISMGNLEGRKQQELNEIWLRISAAVIARGNSNDQDETLPIALQADATRALLIFDCLEPENDEASDLAPLQEMGDATTRRPLANLMQAQ